MLLGALLTASLDPAGKCPVPLASGCHPAPPEGGGKKQMEASYKIGQIAARLRGMGNFPAQPQLRLKRLRCCLLGRVGGAP